MSNAKTEFTSKMAALHSSFEDTLGERIEGIKTVVNGLETQSVKEDLRESLDKLYMLTHKLAGAAGTFGYTDLSDVAKQLEKLSIDALRTLGTKGQEHSENLDRINDQFKALQAVVAGAGAGLKIDGATWQIVLEEIATSHPVTKKVILVDDDETLASPDISPKRRRNPL